MKNNRVKLREWAREHGTSNLRESQNLLQFPISEPRKDNLNFFTRKSKLGSGSRVFVT